MKQQTRIQQQYMKYNIIGGRGYSHCSHKLLDPMFPETRTTPHVILSRLSEIFIITIFNRQFILYFKRGKCEHVTCTEA